MTARGAKKPAVEERPRRGTQKSRPGTKMAVREAQNPLGREKRGREAKNPVFELPEGGGAVPSAKGEAPTVPRPEGQLRNRGLAAAGTSSAAPPFSPWKGDI
jgi:hypothetical protein